MPSDSIHVELCRVTTRAVRVPPHAVIQPEEILNSMTAASGLLPRILICRAFLTRSSYRQLRNSMKRNSVRTFWCVFHQLDRLRNHARGQTPNWDAWFKTIQAEVSKDSFCHNKGSEDSHPGTLSQWSDPSISFSIFL